MVKLLFNTRKCSERLTSDKAMGNFTWKYMTRTTESEFPHQQSAMQMNRCRHLVPLYPYHATNYNYYNLITFNCVL